MWAYHTLKLVCQNPCLEKESETPTKKQSSATHCYKNIIKNETTMDKINLDGDHVPWWSEEWNV